MIWSVEDFDCASESATESGAGSLTESPTAIEVTESDVDIGLKVEQLLERETHRLFTVDELYYMHHVDFTSFLGRHEIQLELCQLLDMREDLGND